MLTRKILLLVIDAILLLLCIAGFEQSRQKSGLRASIEPIEREFEIASGSFSPDTVVVSDTHDDERELQVGDTLISIAGYPLRKISDAEQILDTYHHGERIHLSYKRGPTIVHTSYTLTNYYSAFDVGMQVGAVMILYMLGLFVLSRRPDGIEAQLFHHLTIAVAGIVAFTHGHYLIEPTGVGHATRALLPATYVFIGIIVLHFGTQFPVPRNIKRAYAILLYGAGAVLAGYAAAESLFATVDFSLEHSRMYFTTLGICRVVMVIGATLGILILIVKFSRIHDRINRIQIAWVVIGIAFSVLIYVFLWYVTNSHVIRNVLSDDAIALFSKISITESMLILSLVLTAVFISIGIIRYRIFDIEFFFKRSSVYGLVFAVLLVLYVSILWLAYELNGKQLSNILFFVSIAALLLDLLLFMPVKTFVQRFVDRWFFRVEYDFRRGLTRITQRIAEAVEAETIAQVIVEEFETLLHVYGVMVLTVENNSVLKVLSHTGFPRWRYDSLRIRPERLQELPNAPLILSDIVERGAVAQNVEFPFAVRMNVVLMHTLRNEAGSVIGLLALGEKRTGTRFTLEDLDLIKAVCSRAGLHLERLHLQEFLLMEKQEAAKLRELSQMKSYFVSGVSHDLKTPLTSIKLFAELLEQQIPDATGGVKKYISIIQGECDRLARLINNVLDFTKIERGMMKYSFTRIELNAVIQRAYDVMHYQFVMGGFACSVDCCDEKIEIEADEDALLEAITNLLSNAMKYSGTGKQIALRCRCSDDRVFIDVEDHGLGVSTEDLDHLFEPFYRATSGDVQKHGGVGLGLALVKHIVDAHKGSVLVQSTLGEGSTFTISLPALEAE